jgi:isoleucyl-tRNA synthetase
LANYPECEEKLINSTLETAVGRVQQVINLGRQKRVSEGVKVKTPLKTIRVIHQDHSLLQEIKKLEEYIKSELNIKNVEYLTNEDDFVLLSAKPNTPVLGKKLGKELNHYRLLIEKLPSLEVQKIESGGSVQLESHSFDSATILVFRNAKPGTQAVTNRFITIDLPCDLDQDLVDEGLAREIVSRIQKTRKESNLNVSDRITVSIKANENIERIIKKHQQYIGQETLSTHFEFSKNLTGPSFSHDIDEEKLEISLKKLS